MNPREFTKRWVEGMKNLSLENQIKGMISGAIGNLIGFTGGIITMTYFVIVNQQWQWWWSILILIVALFSTILDLIGKKQQLRQIKSIGKVDKNLSELTI